MYEWNIETTTWVCIVPDLNRNLTISMAIFNSYVTNYKRISHQIPWKTTIFPWFSMVLLWFCDHLLHLPLISTKDPMLPPPHRRRRSLHPPRPWPAGWGEQKPMDRSTILMGISREDSRNYSLELSSGNWKITIFTGKTHVIRTTGPFSIANCASLSAGM